MAKIIPFPKLPTQKQKPNDYDNAAVVRFSNGRREVYLPNQREPLVFWTLEEFLDWKKKQGR